MRYSFASLIIVGCFTLVGVSVAEELRVGIDGDYPPFSYVENGNLAGFEVDLSKALCEQLAVHCQLVHHGWENILPDLEAKKYDLVVASVSITTQRRYWVDFSNKYYSTPSRFVRRKGSNIDITGDSLKNKSVGVVLDSVQDTYVTDLYNHMLKIKRYVDHTTLLNSFQKGETDLIVGDEIALLTGLLRVPEGKDFEFVGPKLNEPEWFGKGIGVAVRRGDQELKLKVNQAIADLRSNGRYQKITSKYFDFDIYGE